MLLLVAMSIHVRIAQGLCLCAPQTEIRDMSYVGNAGFLVPLVVSTRFFFMHLYVNYRLVVLDSITVVLRSKFTRCWNIQLVMKRDISEADTRHWNTTFN